MAVQLSDIFQMIDAGQRAKETRVNILDQLREQQAARALREQELQQQGSQFKDSMGMRDRELKMQEANASQMRELGLAHLLSQGAQPVAPQSHDMFGGLLQTVQPDMENVTAPSNATISGKQYYVPGPNELLYERLGVVNRAEEDELESQTKKLWPVLNPYQRQLMTMAQVSNRIPGLSSGGQLEHINRLWAIAQLPDDNKVFEGMTPEAIKKTKEYYNSLPEKHFEIEKAKANRAGSWDTPSGVNTTTNNEAMVILSKYTTEADKILRATDPTYAMADGTKQKDMLSKKAYAMMLGDAQKGKLDLSKVAIAKAITASGTDVERAPGVMQDSGLALVEGILNQVKTAKQPGK